MMLRKLTKLSRIDFGLHAGKTVEHILRHPAGKSYMTWLYFNASHINLCDELISELEIKHVLMKPGKDPEIYKDEYYQKSNTHKSANNAILYKMRTKTDNRLTKNSLKYANQHRYL